MCGWFWACHVLLALSLAKLLADFSQSQAKTKVVFAASTPRKPLLGHLISSRSVQ
jgi:hypothetical protein